MRRCKAFVTLKRAAAAGTVLVSGLAAGQFVYGHVPPPPPGVDWPTGGQEPVTRQVTMLYWVDPAIPIQNVPETFIIRNAIGRAATEWNQAMNRWDLSNGPMLQLTSTESAARIKFRPAPMAGTNAWRWTAASGEGGTCDPDPNSQIDDHAICRAEIGLGCVQTGAGGCDSWAKSVRALIHEIGHAVGIADQEGDGSPCHRDQYGDMDSIMGLCWGYPLTPPGDVIFGPVWPTDVHRSQLIHQVPDFPNLICPASGNPNWAMLCFQDNSRFEVFYKLEYQRNVSGTWTSAHTAYVGPWAGQSGSKCYTWTSITSGVYRVKLNVRNQLPPDYDLSYPWGGYSNTVESEVPGAGAGRTSRWYQELFSSHVSLC